MIISHDELNTLMMGQPVSSNDIAHLSGHNRIKGIHRITSKAFTGVAILCTIGGKEYPNEWLNEEKTILKYFLEGRKGKTDSKKKFNPNINSNAAVARSDDTYPLLVFSRDTSNGPYYFHGRFTFKSYGIDPLTMGHYFVLVRNDEEVDEYLDESIAYRLSYGVSVSEGKRIIKYHYSRERNRNIIKHAISQAKRDFGKIVCEICDFDFEQRYGKRGKDFIEGHHKKPISEFTDTGGITNIEDIALVCSNCHRMIHRVLPWLSVDEMKGIIRTSS